MTWYTTRPVNTRQHSPADQAAAAAAAATAAASTAVDPLEGLGIPMIVTVDSGEEDDFEMLEI